MAKCVYSSSKTLRFCQLGCFKFLHALSLTLNVKRKFADKSAIILGIETSCDDTGCGIINTAGKILGEAINSQYLAHLK